MRLFHRALSICLLLIPLSVRADDHVTLRLDWVPIGFHAPFFAAVQRGDYKRAGLDVDLLDGKGSANTVQLVGNGADTFGWADSAVTALSASKGVPVKVILGVFRRTAASLNYLPGRGITTIADIKGRTLISCAGSGSQTFLPAFLKTAGMTLSDVKLVNVDCTAIWPLVAQGRGDVSTGYTPPVVVNFARLGISGVQHFDYADAGINLPAHGITAGLDTIKSNPDMIRRFVAVSVKSWQDSIKDPAASVAAMVAQRPLLKGQEAMLETELRGWQAYLDTPRTKDKPFGWQSEEDWKDTEKYLVEYANMKPLPSVQDYYTNEFLPAE